jgi:hypothetical protein
MTKILLITILSLTSFTTSAMPPFHYSNPFKEDAWMLLVVWASFSLMVILSSLIHSYEKKHKKQ